MIARETPRGVLPSRAGGRWRTRRQFIYPHRSVRSIRITTRGVVTAAIMAVTLTVAQVIFDTRLVAGHNRLSQVILELSGIPVLGVKTAQLFPRLVPAAPLPVVAVGRLDKSPAQLWSLFTIGMLVLLELHRRMPLARSFIAFLMTLLVLAAAVVVVHPASQFGSVEFAQNWLRSEVLVWLLLPWFSGGMLVLIQPAKLFGVSCALLTQAYGFVWSSVRLAFSLGVMHYSGILFAPMLWFALGLLADVVYLVVCYSIAVQFAAERSWGRRAEWQSSS